MGEVFDLEVLGEEAKLLCGINERFENEPIGIQKTRYEFAKIMHTLCLLRTSAGRSEAGRNLSLAITDLEYSCMMAIKGLYSIQYQTGNNS